MREHYHLILMGNYADNLDEKILKFLVETIVKTINMNILGIIIAMSLVALMVSYLSQ